MRPDARPISRILLVTSACCVALPASWGGPPPDRARGKVGAFLDGRLPKSAPVPSGGWTTVPAFPLLTFQDPTFLVAEPGSRRLLVGGRQGLIEAIDSDPNASTRATVLDLRPKCQGWDDSGLLGLAFHPEFGRKGSPNRGYFYVAYSHTNRPTRGPDRPSNGHPTTNRLARFTIPDGSTVADPASELVLIDQADESVWHNGGGLFFHPADGFLYLSLGDEGGDFGNAQKVDRDLFSGVIRVDVDRRGGAVSHPIRNRPATGVTDHYFIPNDNPWVGVPDALEEFWAIGFRSPHRMTVDPPTGRVWLGDVGDGSREEVDLVEKGGNYQWNYREGTQGGNPRPSPLIGREMPPLHDYGHDQGSAVIGGYVYRGLEHAKDLGGKYVFGDMNGRIWALTLDQEGRKAQVEPLCDLPVGSSRWYGAGLSSFGIDHDGELYLCRMGDKGTIHRLARSGPATEGWPRTLSKTGAFRDLKSLEPAPGLVPYEVNSPFWSDGAAKRRWVAVPDGEAIGFAPTGSWAFPAGTVFVKHFEMVVDETKSDAIPRRLETRFLVRDAAGSAFAATYKWRPDGSDADLLDAGLLEEFEVKSRDGRRRQSWAYPSPRECLMCHTPASGYALGVNTRQLNAPEWPGGENRLVAWNRMGMFRPGFDESRVSGYPKLVGLADPSATPEAKVRSYLDSNCAHCHRPDGVRARFDARYETDLASQGLIDAPALNPLGLPGSVLVAPRDLSRSVLHRRLEALDPAAKMPPLARNRRDDAAVATLKAWVEALPSGPKPPQVRLGRLKPQVPAGSAVPLAAEVVGEGIRTVEFFRGDVPIGSANAPPFHLDWKPNAEGSYLLTARATDSRGVSGSSEGVMLTVVPPPPPPEGPTTYLDSIRWKVAKNGYGPVEKNRSNGDTNSGDGGPIRLRGKAYAHGLGVHAPSEVRFALDGSAQAFAAEVGVDDETGGAGNVTFEVWADGVKLFDSGTMGGQARAKGVRVDLTGKHELTLIVTEGGDGMGSDHGDWADARLIRPTPPGVKATAGAGGP